MNFLWAIGLLIISYTLQALTAKKPVGTADAKPATFEEFDFPQHDEGTPQSVVFGEVWKKDWIVLYYGNLKSEPIRQKSGSGKK